MDDQYEFDTYYYGPDVAEKIRQHRMGVRSMVDTATVKSPDTNLRERIVSELVRNVYELDDTEGLLMAARKIENYILHG